jgi:hypothetical protein
MTRKQLEDEVDAGKHDAAYWEYVMGRTTWRGEDALFEEIESGCYFDDFVDHLLDKVAA